MNDRTVQRAVKGRARTVPVDSKPKAKKVRGNVTLTPDELTLALDMARSDRLEQELRDYAHRRRVTA